MSDSFYLGAYWGPRAEPIERCTGRLTRCLTSLANVDDLLSSWYPLVSRRRRPKAPKRPRALDFDSIATRLRLGRNRRDSDGSVIEELGYSLSLWNGNRALSAGMSVACGATTEVPGIMNSFVLNLPEPVEAASDLYKPQAAREVMIGVVEAWEPDWAVIVSDPLREAQVRVGGQPFVGWFTYLSGRTGTIPPLPDWATVEPESNGGFLIQVTGGHASVTSSQVCELAAVLASAGSLDPTP